MRIAIALIACFALAACAGSPRPSRAVLERIDRVLVSAPGQAQPGTIVALESAYARMSREEGHWDAAREFMAPGAQIHGSNGPIDADAVFKVVPEPRVQWSVRNVWMSCDGTVAISSGRYVDGENVVGTYATVWQRQPDREYRWIYDLAVPDDPQPTPDPEKPAEENVIIVTAVEAIQGRVADCLKPGEERPSEPIRLVASTSRNASNASADKTLDFMWEHFESGARRFEGTILRDGKWEFIEPFKKETSRKSGK